MGTADFACPRLSPRGVRKRIFDHVPYRLPGAAIELNQSHLLDGAEILRTRVDFDAGQEDGGLVVLESFCLPHHVFAGEIVAALLEHLRKRLCSRVAVKSGTAALVPLWIILVHEGQPILDR